jgi:hypothetical protein
MDALHVTPPFAYTYQCGSTLLAAYLPVYMYSVSLQILSLIAKLAFIFCSNLAPYPLWVTRWFPGIYWPLSSGNVRVDDAGRDSESSDKPSLSLIRPHQILSTAVNNLILMLSFGLCSPILCCFIALSLCVNLCSWLMLIGRFVSSNLDLSFDPSLPPSTSPGLRLTLLPLTSLCLRRR